LKARVNSFLAMPVAPYTPYYKQKSGGHPLLGVFANQFAVHQYFSTGG
jgi:hypothetical protein